jgi:chromosome segregation ATPase
MGFGTTDMDDDVSMSVECVAKANYLGLCGKECIECFQNKNASLRADVDALRTQIENVDFVALETTITENQKTLADHHESIASMQEWQTVWDKDLTVFKKDVEDFKKNTRAMEIDLTQTLKGKADAKALTEGLNAKADKSAVDAFRDSLASKADATALTEGLKGKVDKSAIDSFKNALLETVSTIKRDKMDRSEISAIANEVTTLKKNVQDKISALDAFKNTIKNGTENFAVGMNQRMEQLTGQIVDANARIATINSELTACCKRPT